MIVYQSCSLNIVVPTPMLAQCWLIERLKLPWFRLTLDQLQSTISHCTCPPEKPRSLGTAALSRLCAAERAQVGNVRASRKEFRFEKLDNRDCVH